MSGKGGVTDVEETFRDFWGSRPRRPRRGRKIAGVAAGIGDRYGIDPVIVRVVFVVSAFYGGVGLIAYLLGWLFLPAEDDQVSPAESLVSRGHSTTSTAWTVLLLALLIPATFFFLNHGPSAFIGLALVAAALYLLHRHRGQQGRHGPPAAPAGTAETPVSATATEQTAPTGEGRTPPAWDPLGAAPFAWDLPEPNPREEAPAPVPSPRRAPVGLVTTGLALLLVGGCVLAMQMRAGGWLTVSHVIGLVLGVLGLGMVAGSFLHGGRGLIALALPLAVVGVGLTVVPLDRWEGAGDRTFAPASVQQVLPNYRLSVGNATLDLRNLTGSDSAHTSVDVGMGNTEVRVPSNADVEARCDANVGHVDCLGRESSGPRSRQDVRDEGMDGPGGPKIVLDVHNGMGNVVVRRG